MSRRTANMAKHNTKRPRRASPIAKQNTKQRRSKEQDKAFYQGLALQCIFFLMLAIHYTFGGYILFVTNVTPSWTVAMQIVAMLPLFHQLIDVTLLVRGAWYDRLDYSACLSQKIAEKCCIHAVVYVVWAWSTSRLLHLYALFAATLPQPDGPLGTVGDGQTDHAVACALIYILTYLLIMRFRKSISGLVLRKMAPFLEYAEPVFRVLLRKMSPYLESAKPIYDVVLRKVSSYLKFANHILEVMAGKTAQCLGSAKHTFDMMLRDLSQ